MFCKHRDIDEKITKEELEKIIYSVGSENPDLSEYGGIEKKDGYYLMQHYKEYTEYIEWFLAWNIRKLENTLVIGIGAGGELRCFRDFVECKNTYIIDDGSYKSFHMFEKYNKKHVVKQTNLIEIYGDSLKGDMVEKITDIDKDVKFDLVFVDGWHSRGYLINDTNIGLQFAKKGTLFIFHDTDMLQACNELKKELELNKNFEKVFHSSFKCGLTIFNLLSDNYIQLT